MSIDDIIISAKLGLKNTKYPVKTLGNFYRSLFGITMTNPYRIIAGLLKKYSPEIIFSAIVDLYDDKMDGNKSYTLKYYCESRHRQKDLAENEVMVEDLTEYLKERKNYVQL